MDISKLAVILTASSAGFVAGMKKAEDSAGHFGEALKTAAEVTGILALADAAVEGFSKIAEMTHASLEAIDANAKLSDATGIATESLTKLQYSAGLAGVSNEALTASLQKMLSNLGGVNDELGQSTSAFAKLGLNVLDLKTIAPEEAFRKIAEALQAIENPAERAAKAQAIFGKGARAIMPLLLASTEELKRQSEVAKALGLSYSRVDAAKVEQANDAMYAVGQAIVGVFNQLAVKVAPYIAAAADALLEFAASGQVGTNIVKQAFTGVVYTLGAVADAATLALASFQLLAAGANEAFASMVRGANTVQQYLLKIAGASDATRMALDLAFGVGAAAATADAQKQALRATETLADAVAGANSKRLGDFLNDIEKRAGEAADKISKIKPRIDTSELTAAGKILADLQKQVDEFGLTEGEKKVAELKAAGASPEDIAQAEQLVANLKGLENIKKAQDEATEAAKRYYEESRTPAEKYQAELARVNELVSANLLKEEDAARVRAKLADDYEKATGGKLGETAKDTAPASVDIVASGSQEAAKLVAQFQNGGGGTQQGILQASRKSNDLLNKIAVNTSGFSAPAVFSIGA
jgi:hypothetical protein